MKTKSAGAAVLALAMLLTACGSSGGHGSSSSSSSSSWTVGSVGSYSGAFASSLGPTQQTIDAWAKWVNDNGGINGHKINLVNIDDKGDPATSAAAVKQLVDQNHAIAIIADDTIASSAWSDYVVSKGVPVIGAPFDAIFAKNEDFFPNGTTLQTVQFALMAEAVKAGHPNFGLFYCAEAATCANSVTLLKGLAPKAGANLAYSAKVSASAPDYTAQCLGAKQAGVNALEIGQTSSTSLKIIDSCAQQGYHPQLVGNGGTVTTAWAPDKSTDGTVIIEPDFPVFDKSSASENDFRAALQKYAPQVVQAGSFGANEAEAWTAGLLFEAAAKAGNLGNDATAASVKKGLYALANETLGGLVPPLTFKQGPHSVNCWFVGAIQGGAFTTPQGLKTDCEPGVPTSQ
jgi:branched-chain amino acid transport system substrate-binding protein